MLHVRTDILRVYHGRLEHHARLLERVFPNMTFFARVDQVNLEIGRRRLVECAVRLGVGHVPVVDVIGTEVVDMCDQTREGRQIGLFIAESCSLGE